MEPFPKVVKIGDKQYTFELTSAAHRRVKTLANVSLPDCVADVSGLRSKEERLKALEGFDKLMSDFDRLPVVVIAMLKPQLDAANITEDQFHDLFDGPTALACANAITQALIDFFHGDPRGKLLAAAVEMAAKEAAVMDKWTNQMKAAANRKLATMEETIQSQKGSDAADETIQQTLTNSSTTLPESLASILAPSR